jgi:hypothetical protein
VGWLPDGLLFNVLCTAIIEDVITLGGNYFHKNFFDVDD